MGIAFGILGMSTFLAILGLGWCISRKSHMGEEIDSLQKEIGALKFKLSKETK